MRGIRETIGGTLSAISVDVFAFGGSTIIAIVTILLETPTIPPMTRLASDHQLGCEVGIQSGRADPFSSLIGSTPRQRYR